MRPQAEFVALSAAAGGVAMAAATVLDQSGSAVPWADGGKWVLPALTAAGVGAWLALRLPRARPPARAGSLALRTLLLAVCVYLPALALYVVGMCVASALSAATGLSWQLLPMAFVLGCLPLARAALPFSMIEFFLCRRYLRHARALAGRP